MLHVPSQFLFLAAIQSVPSQQQIGIEQHICTLESCSSKKPNHFLPFLLQLSLIFSRSLLNCLLFYLHQRKHCNVTYGFKPLDHFSISPYSWIERRMLQCRFLLYWSITNLTLLKDLPVNVDYTVLKYMMVDASISFQLLYWELSNCCSLTLTLYNQTTARIKYILINEWMRVKCAG